MLIAWSQGDIVVTVERLVLHIQESKLGMRSGVTTLGGWRGLCKDGGAWIRGGRSPKIISKAAPLPSCKIDKELPQYSPQIPLMNEHALQGQGLPQLFQTCESPGPPGGSHLYPFLAG